MPAHPPFPTASNLPFQSSAAGIHNSISMWESADGVSTMAARQYAGSISGGAVGAPARPTGARNGPAGTDSAAVIVTLGSLSDFKLSQGVWANALVRAKAARTKLVRIIAEKLSHPTGLPVHATSVAF